MKSLAMNYSDMEVAPSKAPNYPSVRISAKSIPELKKATIDSTGKMVVEYKVKGISRYGNGDIEISLDLMSGELQGDK